jgi:hypothetical protein
MLFSNLDGRIHQSPVFFFNRGSPVPAGLQCMFEVNTASSPQL